MSPTRRLWVWNAAADLDGTLLMVCKNVLSQSMDHDALILLRVFIASATCPLLRWLYLALMAIVLWPSTS